jgi:hypothetical protein
MISEISRILAGFRPAFPARPPSNGLLPWCLVLSFALTFAEPVLLCVGSGSSPHCTRRCFRFSGHRPGSCNLFGGTGGTLCSNAAQCSKLMTVCFWPATASKYARRLRRCRQSRGCTRNRITQVKRLTSMVTTGASSVSWPAR